MLAQEEKEYMIDLDRFFCRENAFALAIEGSRGASKGNLLAEDEDNKPGSVIFQKSLVRVSAICLSIKSTNSLADRISFKAAKSLSIMDSAIEPYRAVRLHAKIQRDMAFRKSGWGTLKSCLPIK